MNKIKGVERDAVVWSVQAKLPRLDENVLEWVYTVLTRATKLLIIAGTPAALDEFKEPLRFVRQDRLLFWNAQTKKWFQEFVA